MPSSESESCILIFVGVDPERRTPLKPEFIPLSKFEVQDCFGELYGKVAYSAYMLCYLLCAIIDLLKDSFAEGFLSFTEEFFTIIGTSSRVHIL